LEIVSGAGCMVVWCGGGCASQGATATAAAAAAAMT